MTNLIIAALVIAVICLAIGFFALDTSLNRVMSVMSVMSVVEDHNARLGLLRADVNDIEHANELTRRAVAGLLKCGQSDERRITDLISRVEKLEEVRK